MQSVKPNWKPIMLLKQKYAIYEDELGIFHIWNSVEDVWEITFLSIWSAMKHCLTIHKRYTFITLGGNHGK